MAETFEQFMRAHGRVGHDYPTYVLDPVTDDQTAVIVRFGDMTAVMTATGLGTGPAAHLCIDVHAFVGDRIARSGVFGMENGRRYEAFTDTPGTSHGWPAVRGVSVLIGAQQQSSEPQPSTSSTAPDHDPLYVWTLTAAQRELVLNALAGTPATGRDTSLGRRLAAIEALPSTAVMFDADACRQWLTGAAEDLGIGEHTRNTHDDDEFAAVVQEVLAALAAGDVPQVWSPAGLLEQVLVWRTADSEGVDGGVMVTADLRFGGHSARLAASHQSHGNLTDDSDATGVDAVVQALTRVAGLVNSRLSAARRFLTAVGGAPSRR